MRTNTYKSNNYSGRVVFRLTEAEVEKIDAMVSAAKERGEKSNRSIIAREAMKQLLAA